MLKQVVIINLYIERMAQYDVMNDEPGQAYLYALIFRKMFLFDMPPPDEELEQMVYESSLRAQSYR